MIKKIILLIIALSLVFSVYYFTFSKKSARQNTTSATPTPTVYQYIPSTGKPSNVPTISSNNTDYKLDYLIVRPTDIITLNSNLTDKLNSTEAKNKSDCDSLISGGLYTQDFKPIGLYYSDNTQLGTKTSSALYNGFFGIDTGKKSFISLEPPTDLGTIRFVLQSGPIVYTNSKPSDLSMFPSDPARRILVALSARNEITFIAISLKNNPVSGPKLTELPAIIKNINSSTGLNIVSALNLDGGAHSAFLTQSADLNELSTIGEYFCIKRS